MDGLEGLEERNNLTTNEEEGNAVERVDERTNQPMRLFQGGRVSTLIAIGTQEKPLYSHCSAIVRAWWLNGLDVFLGQLEAARASAQPPASACVPRRVPLLVTPKYSSTVSPPRAHNLFSL